MESNNGDGKSQVAFSLSKKKRKTTTLDAPPLADFLLQESSHVSQKRPERTMPLVIPVQENTMMGPKKKAVISDEDAAAAQALMESAQQHFEGKREDGTNFSADGNLTIASAANTFERKEESDAQQFQRDLKDRADDVPVDSHVYHEIPIAEFGAALLRGMGWKGDDTNSGVSNEKPNDTMPRPHRLGLGATPKMPEPREPGRIRRPDQVARDNRLAQQQQEYEERRQKQIKLDKQQTLQNGSIVAMEGKRARMVQLMGVPGLNRVLVQFEGESSNTSVKRGDVVLVSRDDLNTRPFTNVEESKPNEILVKNEHAKDRYREKDDRKRIKREGEEHSRREDSGDKRRRDEDYARKHSSRDQDHDRDKSREKRRSHDQSRDEKRRRSELEDTKHWLIPNIRVRVVTEKLSSRQYKQKGLILDVTHGGAYATLQMSDGQLLDRVPERYLETALPKAGGNAIVLTGKHRFAKGKLLERSSESGTGIIQVFEDMNVLKLPLDDMAEWCGPLDDDMEL